LSTWSDIDLATSIEGCGFAIVEGLLSAAEVHQLIREIDALPATDDAVRQRRKNGAGFARRNLLDTAAVGRLAGSEAWLSLVHPVVGLESRPVRGILFDKTPDANWLVPWHQDLSIAVKRRIEVPGFGPWSVKAGVCHVQPPVDVLENMITVRLHLDDCGPKNGPLRVVPETHRSVLQPSEIAAIVLEKRDVVCCVAAGGAVVMRPLLLHASSPAMAPSRRRVIHIEYAAGDLTNGLQWDAS
jgi:hypothetical protein